MISIINCNFYRRLLDCIVELLDLILPVKDTIFIGESVAEDAETLDKPNFRVRGCILTIVERLDEEFTKLLKECDPHSNDYVQRSVFYFILSYIVQHFIFI